MITVAGLIKELQMIVKENPKLANYVVILSKDSEGNDFSPLSEDNETPGELSYSDGFYFPDSTWSGSFVSAPEDLEDTDPEDYNKEKFSAICLWPIN